MRRRAPVTLSASLALLCALGAVAAADTLMGTDAAEELRGTPAPDQIYAEGGADHLTGWRSND